ncbi:hypothetical protein AC578_5863 [Pseudocercospora eumusae]|uniref:HSF-type DNA-binding domain-containing protein n=1 Tax=Pseudocercospora eumusae TaxID=321146 RepID=A0A139HCY0_9PEZI|nr:hypothetical protein AC578_5863 [Pseudocercospora eumusae]
MQQSAPNRKRPAPGASPLAMSSSSSSTNAFNYHLPENPDFSNLDFSNAFNTDQTFADPSFSDPNAFSTTLNSNQPHTYPSNLAATPSTDLVRRAKNQHLAPQNGQDAWTAGSYSTGNMGSNPEDETEQDLESKVALAKRDAQGKRKQIPPFVQKLSSFLDSSHTDLIRWSDDGRSFIVLDEDEFARTLIPELFKHNNYASFVRQLNMYGFHKTVNITDGSLRQSEKARKGVKPPSMYSHPYFRKNRPDLLWLIQKPTGKSSAKRKRDGTVKGEGYDSDEERQFSPGPDGRPSGELGSAGGQGLAQLPRNELAAVRQELKKLQQQQNLISRMIAQLKEQNEQFYRQATAFQQLHDRHENSINAILTFLATFYNRSLEGHSGQNVLNMFGNQGQTTAQQQGSVVEEFNEPMQDANNQQVQRYKKPQLLLGAPNAYPQMGGAVTEPNSARPSVSPPGGNSPPLKRDSSASVLPHSATSADMRTTQSPAIKDDASTPNLLNSVPENEEIVSFINNMNATNAANDSTPAYDLSSLPNFSGSAGGLTQKQSKQMLDRIMQENGGLPNSNNALASPNQPRQDIGGMLNSIKDNHAEIERLTELQKDQENELGRLHDRIASASQSPGAYDFDLSNIGNPGDHDIDGFFDSNDYFGDSNNYDFAAAADATNPENMNFDNLAPVGDTGDDMFPGADTAPDPDHLAAPTAESLSSQSTSPAHTTVDDDQDPGTPKKKRRTS